MQTNETIFLKRLSEKEVSDIYESHTIHDFPEEERKPLSSISKFDAEKHLSLLWLI